MDQDEEEHVDEDFMTFIGMESGINTGYGLKSYIMYGIAVGIVIMMVIAVFVYCDYKNRGFGSKYEMI